MILEAIQQKIDSYPPPGRKVVFTNGCFDLVHRGHIDYLSRARELGDCLVVGLNSDTSVQRLKGPERPIHNAQDRALLLAAFSFVDHVILFEEDTPYNLIQRVQPDILVKGGDYVVEDIVGYDIVTARGGRVLTLPFLDGFSTTLIVEKLRKQ